MDTTTKLLVFAAVWWVVWALRGLVLVYLVWARDIKDDYNKDKYEGVQK